MALADRTVLSPNYSSWSSSGRPKAVMIHSTRSGQRAFTDNKEMSATLNWFSLDHANVSSHWVISATEKVRVVHDNDKAWHAGTHNSSAFGIELTQPTSDRAYQDGHYKNLVEVCQTYVAMGVPIVFKDNFANGQQGFTGHEDSQQGKSVGKSDPGDIFDWNRFFNMLRGTEEDEVDELARAQIKVLIASAHVQQEELDLHSSQIDFLIKVVVDHQKRLDGLDSAPPAEVDPDELEKVEKAIKALGLLVIENRKRLNDASTALGG